MRRFVFGLVAVLLLGGSAVRRPERPTEAQRSTEAQEPTEAQRPTEAKRVPVVIPEGLALVPIPFADGAALSAFAPPGTLVDLLVSYDPPPTDGSIQTKIVLSYATLYEFIPSHEDGAPTIVLLVTEPQVREIEQRRANGTLAISLPSCCWGPCTSFDPRIEAIRQQLLSGTD